MGNKTDFFAPGYYQVKIQGHLYPDWHDRFGAMQILTPSSETDRAVTILQGRVRDQAELSGILNTLHELHLPLLSVQYLGDELS